MEAGLLGPERGKCQTGAQVLELLPQQVLSSKHPVIRGCGWAGETSR